MSSTEFAHKNMIFKDQPSSSGQDEFRLNGTRTYFRDGSLLSMEGETHITRTAVTTTGTTLLRYGLSVLNCTGDRVFRLAAPVANAWAKIVRPGLKGSTESLIQIKTAAGVSFSSGGKTITFSTNKWAKRTCQWVELSGRSTAQWDIISYGPATTDAPIVSISTSTA
jgi:hypothetical protein